MEFVLEERASQPERQVLALRPKPSVLAIPVLAAPSSKVDTVLAGLPSCASRFPKAPFLNLSADPKDHFGWVEFPDKTLRRGWTIIFPFGVRPAVETRFGEVAIFVCESEWLFFVVADGTMGTSLGYMARKDEAHAQARIMSQLLVARV